MKVDLPKPLVAEPLWLLALIHFRQVGKTARLVKLNRHIDPNTRFYQGLVSFFQLGRGIGIDFDHHNHVITALLIPDRAAEKFTVEFRALKQHAANAMGKYIYAAQFDHVVRAAEDPLHPLKHKPGVVSACVKR